MLGLIAKEIVALPARMLHTSRLILLQFFFIYFNEAIANQIEQIYAQLRRACFFLNS